MKRTTYISLVGLASSAVAGAFIVLGTRAHRPSSIIVHRQGETAVTQQDTSANGVADDSVVLPSASSNRGDVAEAPSASSDSGAENRETEVPDENAVRERVRRHAMQDVPQLYSSLLEDLGVSPQEKDALLALLIENQIIGTTTRYTRGRALSDQVRADEIADIIGDSRLQQFLALERNLDVYAAVGNIGILLERNDVPLTDAQRDSLFNMLVEVRDEYPVPSTDAQQDSIEFLEHILAQMDERDRLVVALAPSVLSPKQVQYLFEQYQYLAYQRANDLEWQKQRRVDHPTEDLLFYSGGSD